MGALEQIAGGVLMLVILADVFLTVLYARVGTGILSAKLSRFTWQLFRLFPVTRLRPVVLSYCGPVIVVLLVLVWSVLLACGAGLVIHPELGTGVQASHGQTPGDLLTAIYVGGSSLSIVGASDFSPHTAPMQLFFLFNSVVGTSVISLTLTYIMQIYSALRKRNALGLKFHAMSAETGDAAELVARLFPDAQFSAGYNNLSELAQEIAEIKEAHHFYPILFYFRFKEPYYSVSRITLLALDSMSLIKSALSDDDASWLKRSAAVQQLSTVSMMLVSTLDNVFVRPTPELSEMSEAEIGRLRTRYSAALLQLEESGIPLAVDEVAGMLLYLELRRVWYPLIEVLAPTMAYTIEEIDPAMSTTAQQQQQMNVV